MPINGIGRPFEENPKNVRLYVRVTKDEKEKVEKYCKEKGISVSELFRQYIKKIK